MVELFTAECFAPSPTPVRSASPLAELKAPHASRVERAPWPEPLGRDFHPLCAITASMVNHRGFSLSPRLGGRTPAIPSLRQRGNVHVSGFSGNVHRIEHRDWTLDFEGVYSDEPPSSWASTSPCTQLYGSHLRRMVSPAPLAGWSPVYRVSVPISMTSGTLHVHDDRSSFPTARARVPRGIKSPGLPTPRAQDPRTSGCGEPHRFSGDSSTIFRGWFGTDRLPYYRDLRKIFEPTTQLRG